jgi:hypothetical protein
MDTPARQSAAVLAGGLALLAVVLALSAALPGDVGENLTRNTVRLSLAWYAAALVLFMRLAPVDWQAATALGRLARWFWSWGVACFLVHLAMAFHFYHHWSHAHAFETTRQASGTGEGIYASYLFTWLWLGDAAWWWLSPSRYAARWPWLDRALHAFMLFLVFNGTVIFESGAIRWAGLLGFLTLLTCWLRFRGLPRVRPT